MITLKDKKTITVSIVSLGCPKNLVDTEVAAGSLLRYGIGITADPEEADVMLINTCAFIESARKEAFEHIESAIQWKKSDPENRRIVISGCLVEWKNFAEIKAKFPEIDLWTRIDSIEQMGKIIAGEKVRQPKGKPCYLYNDKTDRLLLTPGHYAYLKIADGCDNCCAYCAIPSIRGNLRSRTENSVLKEAENLLNAGVKELIVVAQDTGGFRRDFKEKNAFAHLLKKLDSFDGEYLIRVMYLHPAAVTDELCRVLAGMKHLARCIEMPIQHISDKVLLRMGRKIGGAATREAIRKVRAANCGIRTTLMVGFPGETDSDFAELLEFVKEERFARLGAFVYCAEPGTRAAAMPDQVPAAVAKKRYQKLMSVQKRISLLTNRALEGSAMYVIADEVPRYGVLHARSFSDAPEIDHGMIVEKCPRTVQPGDFIPVMADTADSYDIKAHYLKEKRRKECPL